MKRWGLVWIVAILSCIPILLNRASNQGMLKDTDTQFLLRIIEKQGNPLYWFTHDWPLQNHFYRPVSTLAFEFDNKFYGTQAWGFGLTNAFLCVGCVLLLAWFLREVTDSIPITAAGTALFGLWHWNGTQWFLPILGYGIYAVAFAGFFRHGFRFWHWLPAVGAIGFLTTEIAGIQPLYFRMIGWIPGRTASVMTVFCLIALAAYARYERQSATRLGAKPTSLDEPAGTKSSVLANDKAKAPWIWAFVAFVAVLLALGSYEQAVMLPAALMGVAVSLRLQRYQVRWSWHFVFWGALVLYYFARKAFLPDGSSGYQEQQFRNGAGVFLDICRYLLPSLSSFYLTVKVLDVGVGILLTGKVYATFWDAYTNFAAFWAVRKPWILALTGFALSFLSYLPMAWLNQFDHYHYWPMAMRSLLVVILAWGTWELVVIALSPPATRAHARPVPAPGSLPHP